MDNKNASPVSLPVSGSDGDITIECVSSLGCTISDHIYGGDVIVLYTELDGLIEALQIARDIINNRRQL